MKKTLFIKIEENKNFNNYIPHPEISFIMKEFFNKNPINVSFSKDRQINKNKKNELKKLENKIIKKLIKLIKI